METKAVVGKVGGDVIKAGLGEYSDKYLKELIEESSRKLIDASFRESLIVDVKERQDKIRALVEGTKARIAEKEKEGEKLEGKAGYEARKEISTLKKRLVALENAITKDDGLIQGMVDAGRNLRFEVQRNAVKIEFIKNAGADKIFADYEKHVADTDAERAEINKKAEEAAKTNGEAPIA